MRIVKLEAENVKRLRAVEITPDGNLVVIAGRNGQGKTSVLDAIWYALGGAAAAKGTTKPVRDGARSASVTLDLGDITVTRVWTRDGKTTLNVTSADGARYASPQRMLDDLVGKMSFDPLAFAQLPQREQLAQLLAVVDLGDFDPAANERARADAYAERTDVNRENKRHAEQIKAYREPPADLPDAEVSAGDLVAELARAQRAHDRADFQRGTIRRLVAQIERLREDLAETERELVVAQAEYDRLGDLPDVAAAQGRLDTAEDTNRRIRDGAQWRRLDALLDDTYQLSQALTDRIADLDQEKVDAVTAARMPVEGLAFDDDGVTYLGIPFKQASAAEQLRVSVAMAMALNPRLRVIRITDGSLLDSDNLRLIEAMAAEQDYQIWLERVDESGSVGILIEDGAVVDRPQPAAVRA